MHSNRVTVKSGIKIIKQFANKPPKFARIVSTDSVRVIHVGDLQFQRSLKFLDESLSVLLSLVE